METQNNKANDNRDTRDYSPDRQTDQPYNASEEEQSDLQSDDDNLDDGSGSTARES